MKPKLQLILILISSAIASLGTYPYAKQFAHTLVESHVLSFFIASICIPAAVSANMALGAFSLKNTLVQAKKTSLSSIMIILVVCLLSAASTGFMSFVGYSARLPITLNILVSLAVVLVNAGIGFSAINGAWRDFQKFQRSPENPIKTTYKQQPLKMILILVTILSALIVTLTAYLASAHGLYKIFSYYHIDEKIVKSLAYSLAVIIWVPGAVLFANGSRIIIEKLYDEIKKGQFQFSYMTLAIAFIAFWSGSAYAQMSLEFFNACKCIPNLFKDISRHSNFVFYIIMPLAFFISATVNGYALSNLMKNIKK